jgi:hypothetical protein
MHPKMKSIWLIVNEQLVRTCDVSTRGLKHKHVERPITLSCHRLPVHSVYGGSAHSRSRCSPIPPLGSEFSRQSSARLIRRSRMQPYQARSATSSPYQTHTRPVSSSPYQPYQARCSNRYQLPTHTRPVSPLHTRPVPQMCVCVVSAVLNVRRSGAKEPKTLELRIPSSRKKKTCGLKQ